MSIPASMSEARAVGATRYNTGKPCVNGHYADRYARKGGCVTCHRESTYRTRDKENSRAVHEKWYVEKRINSPEYFIFNSVKSNSKKAGIPFNLTQEYIKSIWPKDNKCPITGMQFYITGREGRRNYRDSASLDRIRPHLGYVIGNVAIISMRANHMKNDVTDPALFRKMADWLEEQLEQKGDDYLATDHSIQRLV